MRRRRPRAVLGFVLPTRGEQQPLAVVEGSLYPVLALGERIDLEVSCEGFEAMRGRLVGQRDDSHLSMLWGEARDGTPMWCPALEASLYLQRPGLARGWENLHEDPRRIHHLFDRALAAHAQGDDRDALYAAGLVTRSLRDLSESLSGSEEPDVRERLRSMMEGARALQLDQLRRRARHRRRSLSSVPTEGVTPPSLIPELIERLEDVREPEGWEERYVDFSESPVVNALVRAGEAALPALMDCLEHDHRLTRTIAHRSRSYPTHLVLGVYQAAYMALSRILEVHFFDEHLVGPDLFNWDSGMREFAIELVSNYLREHRLLNPIERRYRDLVDEEVVHEGEWVRAAQWLTEAEPESPGPHGPPAPRWMGPPRRGLRGDPLRARRDPSVAELLARRAEQSSQQEDSSGIRNPFDEACPIAEALAVWDVREARRRLPSFAERCIPDLRCSCAGFSAALLGGDDPAFLSAYVERLRGGSQEPDHFQMSLLPFAVHDRQPVVRRALEEFLSERGPFAIRTHDHHELARILDFLLSELGLHQPELQAYLRRGLAHVEVVALYDTRDGSRRDLSLRRVRPGMRGQGEGEGDEERRVRVADLFASALSEPLSIEFHLEWSRPRRDRAIERIRRALAARRPAR